MSVSWRRARAVLVGGALVVAGCAVDDSGDGRVVAPPTERSSSDELFDAVVTSHEGSDLRLEIGLLDGGVPAHRVIRTDGDGEVIVVDVSPIGLATSAGSFLDGLSVVDPGEERAWSSSIDAVTGKRRTSDLEGVLRTSTWASPDSSLLLEIDAFATDHAVAFRTRLVAAEQGGGEQDGAEQDVAEQDVAEQDGAEQDGGSLGRVVIEAERTSFAFDVASTAWLQPHDEASSFTPAYERIVPSGRPLASPVPSPQGWTLPALLEHDGAWTLLAEAGLGVGWSGSHLRGITDGGELTLTFPDAAEGFGVGDPRPQGTLPLTSPWRVVLSSTDVGDLVESDVVRHLSAVPDERDWSWVEPGRVSWSWWADNDSPTDADRLIDHVEFSAEFGWEYSLIDANWNLLADVEFTRVVDRADELGVGLLLWYNSGGSHNDVTEAPRGLMSSPEIRHAEMERIAALGIRGIKVDFFHSDKPDRIEQYLGILADAADARLLVNFHGSTVPRGWSRTWPNLMTMEAVAGGEQYLFNRAYAQLAPGQNTVLPFLRNVVGPMDFTPTTFDPDLARSTSDAHELALAVLFESGLQHLVDRPETYRAQPAEVQDVLRDLPVAWDEIVYLDGRPDEFVVLARRVDDEWWIAAIDGSDTARSIAIADLLVADDRTAAAIDAEADVVVLCDGEDRRSWSISSGSISSGALPATIDLLPDGGCLVRITPS